MTPMYPKQNEDPDAPDLPQLSNALKRLYESPGTVPDAVREHLVHQARGELGNVKRTRRWGGIGIVAAAAMIVFAFQLVLRQVAFDGSGNNTSTVPPNSVVVATTKEDIDGNGRVDILDAFALARRIENADDVQPNWDINADGSIDQRDIDLVAQSAVRLKGGA